MGSNTTSDKGSHLIRVLVADDSLSNLILMGRILSNFDCEYDFAKSGSEVLVKLGLGDFNLVFMECRLPEMNGHAVVRKIREAGKHENLKIICTANSRTNSRCTNCSVDGFLDRPLGMWKIRRVLEKAFPEVFEG